MLKGLQDEVNPKNCIYIKYDEDSNQICSIRNNYYCHEVIKNNKCEFKGVNK